MFESDLDQKARKVQRRTFLMTFAGAIAGSILWSMHKPRLLAAAATPPSNPPGEVTIVEFSDEGKKPKKVHIPKVVKTEAEWKQQLSPGAFEITRHADTEIAFTGK